MKTHKRALITGASKGLGREITLQLLESCENLALLGRDEPALTKFKNELLEKYNYKGEIDILVIDLADSVDLEKIKQYSKSVDLFINNAGLGFVNSFTKMNEANLKSMLMVNNYALTMLTHWYAGKMSAQGSGQIINIASAAAFLPIPFFSVYAATKSYVLYLSQALDGELRKKGVRVKALCPGGIKTNFHLTAGMTDKVVEENKNFMADPRDVAAATIQLINSRKNVLTPGAPNKILKFLTWLFPTQILVSLAGRAYEKYSPR